MRSIGLAKGEPCSTAPRQSRYLRSRTIWALSCFDLTPHRVIADTPCRFILLTFRGKLFIGDCCSEFRYNVDMSSVDSLFEEAKQLPVDQRLTLVSRLLRSDEPSVSEEVEREWDVVIRERIHRYDEGKALSRPAGEVFADLDRRLTP